MTTAAPGTLVEPILRWYEENARALPWRRPDASPWEVLVSEIMLQQTPVARVLPAWEEWLRRWPTPAALAAEEPGEAVRQWGRLGYPRRALRLHASAQAMVEHHGGEVPASYDELRALPGVGAYTAAAVAAFAFSLRHVVLDTNIRRVLGRLVRGDEYPPKSQTSTEVRIATDLLPEDSETAARWSVGVMELGALVCTARSPRCDDCPLREHCTWRLAGKPEGEQPAGQRFAGTDRQVRGRLMAVLRDSPEPVTRPELEAVWDEAVQRERALDGLVTDGLVEPLADGRFALPG